MPPSEVSPALPPVPAQAIASDRDEAALARLASDVRRDLARLNFPPANWVPAATAPDGEESISMEEVMGTKSTRKGPASESKAESVESHRL